MLVFFPNVYNGCSDTLYLLPRLNQFKISRTNPLTCTASNICRVWGGLKRRRRRKGWIPRALFANHRSTKISVARKTVIGCKSNCLTLLTVITLFLLILTRKFAQDAVFTWLAWRERKIHSLGFVQTDYCSTNHYQKL